MEKEFVTYKQSLALKELGFDAPCLTRWGNTSKKLYSSILKPISNKDEEVLCGDFIAAPIKQQLFKWFREKYNLIGLIEGGYDNGNNLFTYVIWQGSFDNSIDTYWKTYEEAESACIDKLIEICKTK
jgi:hypothetical protein